MRSDLTLALVPEVAAARDRGVEDELRGSGILTPGKPWYAIIDTKGPNFYALGLSLAATAPIADPLLGSVNVDAGQAIWLSLGATSAAGLARVEFNVPEDDFGADFDVFGQAFVPNATATAFDATRGLAVHMQQ